jgi:hypothetical protein
MELPEDVVTLIREFSQPLTRPDWRTLHLMTAENFHMSAMERFAPLFYELVMTSIFKRKVHYSYHVFNLTFIYKSC